MEKRELVALLSLSSWCLVMVAWLFLVVPWVCLWFVIVVFPDHTHLLFLTILQKNETKIITTISLQKYHHLLHDLSKENMVLIDPRKDV